jgi:four helix bundle protein
MKDEKDLRNPTKAFALRTIAPCETLLRSGSAQVLSIQVLRFGTSIDVNSRDAHRARSSAEFVSKVSGSLTELVETAIASNYWQIQARANQKTSLSCSTKLRN